MAFDVMLGFAAGAPHSFLRGPSSTKAKACQGPEPRLSSHRPRRRQPCLQPISYNRHGHEEGSREDFGRKWKVVLERDIGVH